jgi:hypothetical protein
LKKRRRLAGVTNRQGRLDVLLYQLAVRAAERIEREQGLAGIREYVLPLVEEVIREHVPAKNLIPRELCELFDVWQMNRQRLRC